MKTSRENYNLIRVIWSTRDQEEIINEACKKTLVNLFQQQLKVQSCKLYYLNITPNYVDLILDMHTTNNLAAVMQYVKGSSSYHINKHNLTEGKFIWDKSFFSESRIQENVTQAINELGKRPDPSFFEQIAELKQRIHKLTMLAQYA